MSDLSLSIFSGSPVNVSKDAFSYIRRVNSIPYLSYDEEASLCNDFYEKKDLKAGEKLFLHNLRLVVKIVMEYKSYKDYLADIISEGNMGLVKALNKFSPEKGMRFGNYATMWIKSCINDFLLKTKSIIKIGTTSMQKKIMYNASKVRNELMRNNKEISDENMADGLGVSVKDFRIISDTLNVSSTDYTFSNGEAFEHSDNRMNPEDSFFNAPKEKHKLLYEAIENALTDREKDILQRRFLSDDKDTLHDLSLSYQVSKERIRQIENMAMKKVRNYILEKPE